MIKGKKSTSQAKSELKRLKKLGLYSGNLRKAPTRYAVGLLDKYSDVLAGRAKVVTIKKHATGRATGKRAASMKAKELSAEFSKIARSYKDKLIIRTARADETPFYSEALDTIVSRYKSNIGGTVTHEYIRGKTLTSGDLPALQENESYALPFSRGRDGISYTFRATKKEILDLANQYETNPANPYRDATGNIQIVYSGKKRRKSRAKKSATDNVIPFRRG